MQKVKEEAFRAIGVIYIEPFASRLPPVFWDNSESYGEERDVKHESFEALKHVAIVGEGFEKPLQGLERHFLPPAPTFVKINDSKEEDKWKGKLQK